MNEQFSLKISQIHNIKIFSAKNRCLNRLFLAYGFIFSTHELHLFKIRFKKIIIQRGRASRVLAARNHYTL
jgi:hypothetical protein